MKLQIRQLQKKDHKKAIQFAIKGMHFDWYLDNSFLLYLYGTYFWYMELLRATQVIAVYAGEELAGVLLAEIYEEEKIDTSFGKKLYVRIFDFLQNLSYKGVGTYDNANREMYALYRKRTTPDGELIFLAANPGIKIKGIGSLLLQELECREPGKQVFLYTDNACTYQFYEHRGFQRVCEKEILLALGKKEVPLECLLYAKTIPCL